RFVEQQTDHPRQATWQVEPAPMAKWHLVPNAPMMCLLATSIGLLSAGAVTLLYSNGATIQSPADASTLLSVPVAGTIHDAKDSARIGRTRPWPLAMTLTCAEWILCGMFLSMVTVTMFDPQFAQQAAGDPLAALADSVRRMLAFVWS
ncbi:MAG: hypothetical protein N2C12_06700, partial [Planctomycetales bacterium]